MIERGKALGFSKTEAGRELVEYLHGQGERFRNEDMAMLFAPTPLTKFKVAGVWKMVLMQKSGQGTFGRSIRVLQDIQDQNAPRVDPNANVLKNGTEGFHRGFIWSVVNFFNNL